MSADRVCAAPLAAAWEAGVAAVVLAGSPAAPIGAAHPLGFGTATPPCLPGPAAASFSLGGKPVRIRLRETAFPLAQRAAYLPEPEAA